MAEKDEEEKKDEELEEEEDETEDEEEGEDESDGAEEEDEDGADDDSDPDGLDEEDDDIETLKSKNKKLFERAKKAEGFVKDKDGKWVKKTKTAPAPNADSKTNAPAVDPDELRAIAAGYSEEEIAKAKVIAKGGDMTLPEALKDPLFLTFQKDFKERERKRKAKLGASRGSDANREEAPVSSGMSRDQHKEAWDKTVKGTK